MRVLIFCVLIVLLLISPLALSTAPPEFLDLNRELLQTDTETEIKNIYNFEFVIQNEVLRNPFRDFRIQQNEEEYTEGKDDVIVSGQIPFTLRGIITFQDKKAALLTGDDFSKIAYEGDIVEGYRLTGIYEKYDMVAFYYNQVTIRMRIGGEIIGEY